MTTLCEHFILPLTVRYQSGEQKPGCSYVELVATAAQPPNWFVSHAVSAQDCSFVVTNAVSVGYQIEGYAEDVELARQVSQTLEAVTLLDLHVRNQYAHSHTHNQTGSAPRSQYARARCLHALLQSLRAHTLFATTS